MELWIIPTFVIFLLHAGFALLETGLCRAKNSAHTMSMNFLAFPLATVAFFAVGFALMCGGAGSVRHSAGSWGNLGELTALQNLWTPFRVAGHPWGLAGGRGFFLAAPGLDPAAHDMMLAAFLCMLVYASAAATIPTGAMVERWSFRSFTFFTLLVSAVIFPLFGCWVWGGGWLAMMGKHLHLGNGAVDYAGSSVVHLVGGSIALAGVLQLGPRIGKYDAERNARPIFGHHVPMLILGTLILGFAWLGFNTARSFAARDGRAVLIAVNTCIAAAAGALAAALYMWNVYGKPDPSLMCNGMLGALVASCAPCAYVEPWAAFLIGLIAGVLAPFSVLLLERRGIDDPVGAVSVHGINGLWGMIALGLFANGTFGAGTNRVDSNVTGLFYGGGRQFIAQLIASGVCIVWSFGLGWIGLALVKQLLGRNRVSIEVEIAGLDIAEMGAGGYPEFIDQTAPEQVPASEIAAARMGK